MRLPLLLTLCMLALSASVTAANAATTFVPNRFDDPGAGGKSCAPPAPVDGCSLRGAVEAAEDGDTIDLATGKYTLAQGELDIGKAIEIVGDGPAATTIQQTGLFRVLDVSGGGLTMSGTTISGGHLIANGGIDGSTPGEDGEDGDSASGGGIRASAPVALADVVVTGNGTYGGDGGNGGTIESGAGGAGGRGGSASGAGISGGPLVLTRVAIVNNTAKPGNAGDGGSVTLTGNGGAGGKGGSALGAGIAAGSAAVTVSDSVIAGNSAGTTAGGEGGQGGLLAGGGGIGGQGEAADGAGVFGNGVVRLSNVTITGNVAAGGVGGKGGAARSTLAATTGAEGGKAFGGQGGGIALFNGAKGQLASVTLAGNSATAPTAGLGGAGSMEASSGATGFAGAARGNNSFVSSAELSLRDTILADPGAPGTGNCGFSGGSLLESLGHNLEDGEDCIAAPAAGDIAKTPAGLGPLQDNGGPTGTMALLPGSAAIDAGEPTCVDADGAPLSSDQRGEPRLSPCDIGAFEVQPEPPSPIVVSEPSGAIPNLYKLRVLPAKVRNGKRAVITFRLTRAARVRFALKRKLPGVKVGKKCLPRSKARRGGKPCRRMVKARGAPKAFLAKANKNRRRWTPRGLKPGKYKLFATPAGGQQRGKSFVVLKTR